MAKQTDITTRATRRGFLSGAAGLAAGGAVMAMATIPAVAVEPDPIFAAIERHRAAWAAYDASLGEDHLEEYIPREQRQSCVRRAFGGDLDWRVPTDHPDWIAHIELSMVTWTEEAEAACALVSTEDLTPAGAIALLNYAKERSDDTQFWQDLEDEDGKLHTWHYYLFCQVTEAFAATA